MALLAPLPARVPPPPTERHDGSFKGHHAVPSLGHSARAAGALTAAAAAAVASRRPETVRNQVLLRAAGSDFAIIRFRIPGVDDLTMLPRVVTAFCVALFIYNKVSAYGDPDSFRQVSETLAVVLSLLTWSIPWVTGRLEEAVRRQVDAKPSSRKPGSIQTLAIKQELSSELQLDISWLSSSLLRLTNADGLAIWHEGSTICSRGIVKRLKGFAAGSEFVLQGLDAAWTPDAAPVDGYCATRRGLEAFPDNLLPGKVLPDDTESAIVKPLPGGGHLVLWSARPRAFDKEADRLWVANAAGKLGGLLHGPKSTVPDTVLEECFEDTLPLLAAEEDAEAARDPFARFDLQIRVAPTIVGVLGLGVLIFNRQALVFSEASRMGVDPAQTRADLCAGVLAITLVLQGLVWVSETPKSPDVEDTAEWDDARNVLWVDPQLAEGACQELVWSWSAFSKATRACSMALFWRDKCVMQGGLFQPGMDPVQRDFCKEVISMGKGRYLAQLNNYPAKEEFLDFLPKKTQGLLLTPLRPARNAPAAGLLVLGLNAMRGFGKVDQAWAAALAEKLAVTLDSSD